MQIKVRETISKREVNSIVKKLSKELLPLVTLKEVESLIKRLVPDAEEFETEVYDSRYENEFEISFVIPKNYVGKHTESEYKKSVDDFDYLASSEEDVVINIERDNGGYVVTASAYFRYFNFWRMDNCGTVEIKKESIKIPIEFRKKEVDKLLSDIAGLSSGTLTTLMSEEKIGEASSLYVLIDEVQKRFLEFTKEYINSTLIVYNDWQRVWDIFKKENPVSEIAKSLGLEDSVIKPNYKEWSSANNELLRLREELSELVNANEDIRCESISLDDMIKLTYAHALSVVKLHSDADRKESMNKVLLETIPKILNGEYDREFYQENSQRGLKVLVNI